MLNNLPLVFLCYSIVVRYQNCDLWSTQPVWPVCPVTCITCLSCDLLFRLIVTCGPVNLCNLFVFWPLWSVCPVTFCSVHLLPVVPAFNLYDLFVLWTVVQSTCDLWCSQTVCPICPVTCCSVHFFTWGSVNLCDLLSSQPEWPVVQFTCDLLFSPHVTCCPVQLWHIVQPTLPVVQSTCDLYICDLSFSPPLTCCSFSTCDLLNNLLKTCHSVYLWPVVQSTCDMLLS